MLSSLKVSLIAAVASFKLRDTMLGWPGDCDPLIVAVRKYYLLLPRIEAPLTWLHLGRLQRQATIKSHLERVCSPGSILGEHIQQVDGWLRHVDLSRDSHAGYARLLEGRYGSLCFYCGMRIADYPSVDHIIPLTHGGWNNIDNFALLHRDCNSSKNRLLLGDGLSWIGDNRTASAESVPRRLKFLVLLRDGHCCTHAGCSNGFLTRHQLRLRLRYETGVACYDNLTSICEDCFDLMPETTNAA